MTASAAIWLRKALGISIAVATSLAAGVLIGFGSLGTYAWHIVEPGCRCPADRLYLARNLFNEQWPWAAGLSLLAAIMVLLLIIRGARYGSPWRLPVSLSLASAACLLVVLKYLNLPTGDYMHVPFGRMVPWQVEEPVVAVADVIQSWSFVAALAVWPFFYLAVKLVFRLKGLQR